MTNHEKRIQSMMYWQDCTREQAELQEKYIQLGWTDIGKDFDGNYTGRDPQDGTIKAIK